jgi:hypothetical protein
MMLLMTQELCFLLAFEVAFAQHVRQQMNIMLLVMSLDLDGIAGRKFNVRNGPGSLLDDFLLGIKKQLGQHTRAGTISQGGISLNITACNDVD